MCARLEENRGVGGQINVQSGILRLADVATFVRRRHQVEIESCDVGARTRS